MRKFFVFFVLIILIGCTTEISTQKIKQKNTAVEINNQNIDDVQNKSDGITASAITEINQNNSSEKDDSQKTTYNEVDIDIKKNKNTKISDSSSTGATQTTKSTSTSSTSQNTTEINDGDSIENEDYQILGNVICLNENQVVLLDEISCETDFDCTEDVLMDLCDYELTFEDYINEKTVPDCAIKVICEQKVCQTVCEI